MADAPEHSKAFPIKTENGTFYARIYGEGSEYALAIHGFNMTGAYFETISQQFPKLSICAIDLPWHGKTEWKRDTFNLRDFDPIIKFLDTQGPIHLIGHSMGARIAIALSQVHPRLTKSMCLLSPDGIAGPYRFMTEYVPIGLRKNLERLMRKPQWVLDATDFLYSNNIINKFPYAFANKHLKNPDNRVRLFKCWQSLPNFPVTLGANVDTPTAFILGKRDPLVNVEGIRKFAQLLSRHNIYELDRGHDVLPLPPGLEIFQ